MAGQIGKQKFDEKKAAKIYPYAAITLEELGIKEGKLVANR